MLKRIGLLIIGLIGFLLPAGPALAQEPITPQHTDPVWGAWYWNNVSLSGPPVLQRCDPNLDFDWGGGSPDPAISAGSEPVGFEDGLADLCRCRPALTEDEHRAGRNLDSPRDLRRLSQCGRLGHQNQGENAGRASTTVHETPTTHRTVRMFLSISGSLYVMSGTSPTWNISSELN